MTWEVLNKIGWPFLILTSPFGNFEFLVSRFSVHGRSDPADQSIQTLEPYPDSDIGRLNAATITSILTNQPTSNLRLPSLQPLPNLVYEDKIDGKLHLSILPGFVRSPDASLLEMRGVPPAAC